MNWYKFAQKTSPEMTYESIGHDPTSDIEIWWYSDGRVKTRQVEDPIYGGHQIDTEEDSETAWGRIDHTKQEISIVLGDPNLNEAKKEKIVDSILNRYPTYDAYLTTPHKGMQKIANEPRNYLEIGHENKPNQELWWFEDGNILTEKVTNIEDKHTVKQTENFFGRIDHDSKRISITSPRMGLENDKRINYISKELRKLYPDYYLYLNRPPTGLKLLD